MASIPISDESLKLLKARLIEEILSSSDLYTVLGASRSSSTVDLRRHYLDRSRIIHPDKLPGHPKSTLAFQRLSRAYEILKEPSLRAHYDLETSSSSARAPSHTHKRWSSSSSSGNGTFLAADHTFRGAVSAILQEFLHGDFRLVRRLLETLNRQYPNLVNEDVIVGIERSFHNLRELVLTTQTYALLISIELGRLHRVQKRLRALGYLDVVGRVRCTMQLVRVTLAIPIRVDRALREREMRRQKVRIEASGATTALLNEKVCRVLEFIVGQEVEDMPEDGRRRREYWPAGGEEAEMRAA